MDSLDSEGSPEAFEQDSDTRKKPDDSAPTKKPGSKGQGRKRTKTGCLTCRKRRIKCGEERPTCQNCTKSKRQCEGYNKRVVFKDPINIYRPPLSASNSASGSRQSANRHALLPQGPDIAQDSTSRTTKSFNPSASSGNKPVTGSAGTRQDPGDKLYSFQNAATIETYANLPKALPTSKIKSDTADRSRISETKQSQFGQEQAHYDTLSYGKPGRRPDGNVTAQRSFESGTSATLLYPITTDWGPSTAVGSASSVGHNTELSHPGVDIKLRNQENSPLEPEDSSPRVQQNIDDDILDDEDDPFDVSDDDTPMEEYDSFESWKDGTGNSHLEKNDLGIMVARMAGHRSQDLTPRSFISFIDRPDMLATYIPSPSQSPLNDSMTARLFCHFVNVTAPTISIAERHTADPLRLFQGQPVPLSQQHIWTYTFPTLALHNPALLHAMLALASLHVATLQNGPVTSSLKHYSISLRRTAKCLNSPTKRGEPATLAAALLLSLYECWGADHQKWSNHVLGARQLVREIDFAGMTRSIKALKIQKRQEERQKYYEAEQRGLSHYFHVDETQFQAHVDDLDENLVGMLMGTKLQYDDCGQVLEQDNPVPGTRIYTEKEMEMYETQRDLFWWYCKQDVYQSILGGGRLFMEYSFWGHCPPRAPLGRLNATYGTYDHVLLLMGRIADFAARDLRRKREAMNANGGWRPSEAMLKEMGESSQGPPRQSNPQQPQQSPSMPTFPGMVPNVGEAQLPMGFGTDSGQNSPQSTYNDETDLATQLIEAEEEWQDIRNAFSILADHFGEDLQALGPEFFPPTETPFGTALQYRTYGISNIWLNYYMGIIFCHRVHPSMPPSAMMAAGVAARQTAFFANEMGRVAAGIAPDCGMMAEVNPNVGSALIESSTCLFLAGVQYQNPLQRSWLINRLRDIGHLTGWQTAVAIATGCEISWIRAAEMGRGPPYTRAMPEKGSYDVWAHDRRINRAMQPRDERATLNSSGRVHYALGVLGLEDDFEKLGIEEN